MLHIYGFHELGGVADLTAIQVVHSGALDEGHSVLYVVGLELLLVCAQALGYTVGEREPDNPSGDEGAHGQHARR